MGNICQILWLGQIEYETAWKFQKNLVAKRATEVIPNTLLLLEHPHTYTIGLDGHREHLLIDPEELARLNIAYHQVDRGGSVTYHGPGQLVVYPILNLREYGYSYHRYIAMLESVIIRALSFFKIQAFRQRGQRGIWVLPGNMPRHIPKWVEANDHIARIGAVGVKVNEDDITSHGFFINVDPNLEYFDLIIPCGLQGCHITSLRHVLDKPIEIGTVVKHVIQSFCEIFKLEPLVISPLPFMDKINISQATNLVG